MKLDWKKMCYEEVLDFHPDRLADSLSDYLISILTRIKSTEKSNWSIDVVLSRENVFLFIETNCKITKKIEDLLKEITETFFYEKNRKNNLEKCLGIRLETLKINLNITEQSQQLAKKSKKRSNDNCVINYYNSPKLREIKNTFSKVKDFIQNNYCQWIALDGKMLLTWDKKKDCWICYLTLCFLRPIEEQIPIIIKDIEETLITNNRCKNVILKVANSETKDWWCAPASFMTDNGITGRKLQSDFFYGLAPHQQGSIHGKDNSKYDRGRYEELTLNNWNREVFISEGWLCNGKKPIKKYEENLKKEL